MKIITVLTLSIIVLLLGCTTAQVQDIEITSNSKLNDFYGKPSVILFGGTYCEHCKAAIPVFKEKVYDVYNEEMNIWINVVDGGLFEIEDIPQGLNLNLDFNNITNTKCGYVPSWIVLDETGKVALSSCGGEKELSEMMKTIKELI